MRVATVLGTVVMTTKVECLTGHRFLLVQPRDCEGRDDGEPVVAIDTISAAQGQTVYIVEKREAAKAFGTRDLPCDVTILGIVDEISVRS